MKRAIGDRKRWGRTRFAILKLLKTLGSTDATKLARRLKVSPMAVRQHLYKLQDEGSVSFRERAEGVGRPEKIWELTENSDRFFPDHHASFAAKFIDAVEGACGSKVVQRVLKIAARDQLSLYRERISKHGSLREKLASLADLRTAEGFMADLRRKDEVSFLFVENHCPICQAATACDAVCAAELDLFHSVFGKHVRFERTEHILAGDRRCAYRVTSQI